MLSLDYFVKTILQDYPECVLVTRNRQLQVKLLRVGHTGTYIGNQWRFEIIVNGHQTRFQAPNHWELRPGESEIVTHQDVYPKENRLGPLVVFEKNLTTAAFPIPIDIYVKASDRDQPPTYFTEEGRQVWKENYGDDDEGSNQIQQNIMDTDSQLINLFIEVEGDGLAERDVVTKIPHKAKLQFVFEASSG